MEFTFIKNKYNIKEFLQPEEIRYSKEFSCECGFSNFTIRGSINLIGYTSTQNGYMAVFECEKCGERYRHHINSVGRYDFDNFIQYVGMIFKLEGK